MKQNIYADRVSNISVTSGVVHLNFLAVKDVESETKQVNLEEAFCLHMPIDGVMQTIEALEKLKDELVEQAKKQS